MIKMVGYRLLVKPKEREKVSEGGIILVELDERMHDAGNQFGTVISIGESCWGEDEPWCSEGDEILFSKFAGRFVYDPDTKEEFMVMNDTDVIAITASAESA